MKNQITNTNTVEGIFLSEHQHECIPAYWGVMHKIATIPGCSMYRVRFHEGATHHRHVHEDRDEIIYVVAGELRQIIGDGEPVSLKPGEAAIIPKGTPHEATGMVKGTEVIVMLNGDEAEYSSKELTEPLSNSRRAA